jgi:TPP-dependent trihydroxycyclohexane-1,2-dione (THcHDO) dehydratase
LAGVKKAYCIVGDGAYLFSIKGIIEAIRNNLNINIIVIENGGVGKKEKLNIELIKTIYGFDNIFKKKVKEEDLKEGDLIEMENFNGVSVLFVNYLR